ncbi:MAG TPA: hypothetical protein VGM30_11880 [Puia sp.]|jgi:glycosyltransferase involved in cell wall biosynthesis
MRKVCIVTNRHLSYNPRVLKEADALYAAGYEVSVVTINGNGSLWVFDQELMRTRKWKLQTVNFRREPLSEKINWFLLSLKQQIFHRLYAVTGKFGIAERVVNKTYDPLTRLAKKEGADLYIVHHAEALGAGYRAASANGARLGFDAEDFHTGMNEPADRTWEDDIMAFLEKKYLPRCDYYTAASKGIAEAYRSAYRIDLPTVVLNVFPREHLPAIACNEPVRFYWYSQVIGPGRGIEGLLEAAGRIGSSFKIHIRGDWYSESYRATLEGLVKGTGLEEKIVFHPPIPAEDIIKDGSRFDVGLALEMSVPVNRDLCVTNKVFSYLMSGLALIGTDTYGQRDIFSHFPDAVRIVRIGDTGDLETAMRSFIDFPDRLLKAKTAARNAANGEFNWESESEKLLRTVRDVLNQ